LAFDGKWESFACGPRGRDHGAACGERECRTNLDLTDVDHLTRADVQDGVMTTGSEARNGASDREATMNRVVFGERFADVFMEFPAGGSEHAFGSDSQPDGFGLRAGKHPTRKAHFECIAVRHYARQLDALDMALRHAEHPAVVRGIPRDPLERSQRRSI